MLKTRFAIGEIPHSEYPRPQLVRDSYLCLNGKWSLKKTNGISVTECGEITVPFSPEVPNSGIGEGFVLGKNEKLIYERNVDISEDFLDEHMLIHFGAVDSECKVYLNDEFIGEHVGGYTPFCFDISNTVKIGKNALRVECVDTTEESNCSRGKQSKNRGTIWYTAQSGIWQTVWLESMPSTYIKDLTVKTDALNKEVFIKTVCDDVQHISIYDGSVCIYKNDFKDEICVKYDFELWSPESPKLYDLEIVTDSGDNIRSYFGVRSFGIGKDEKGIPRLLLNGKPYFFNGILDQGYWSDGLLTPPSDEAMLDELSTIKAMGFNMIRKHIKIEPLRWYCYCDRLGLVVWQDFVNGGGEYKFLKVAALPFLGFKHSDDDYKYFARENEKGRTEYENSLKDTIANLKNCTCIGAWVPFNEGWGQFDSSRYTELVRSLDNTRVIDSVSGWYDQGVEKTELRSLHTYYTPLRVPKDSRPVVLSEFGGYSLKIDGHVFDPSKTFGYRIYKSKEDFGVALEKLYLKKLLPLISKGLCACVYTQVSDVEEEINGLITYDRDIIKVSVERMKKINDRILDEASKIR